MSNTWKHKKFGRWRSILRKHKAKRDLSTFSYAYYYDAEEEYQKKYKKNSSIDCYGYNFYGKNPSWWNHEMMEVPNRRITRDLLKKIDVNNCDEGWEEKFPLARKPSDYYW